MLFSRFTHRLGCLALLCGLALSAVAAEPVAKFVLALKPDKNPEVMKGERQALTTFLTQKLRRPVEIIIPLSSSVILEGFANGTIDVGYLSATDLVNARQQGVARLLLAGQFRDGRNAYDSYWVVRHTSAYKSISDLRGKPVAFASRTSTSGFVIPVLDLRQRGLIGDDVNLEAFFGAGNVTWGSGYVSAIERVLAGEAEAAAVSYYVLDEDKHLTLDQRAQLRRLQAQGPVPSHVLAIRTTLVDADREALKTALLGLNELSASGLRDRLFTTRLVEADEAAHVASLEEALALARKALKQ